MNELLNIADDCFAPLLAIVGIVCAMVAVWDAAGGLGVYR